MREVSSVDNKPNGIAYLEAKQAWDRLQLTAEQLSAMRRYMAEGMDVREESGNGHCPVCGFDGYGFVHFAWPTNHLLFGKPVYCPTCWPYPFGNNPSAVLPVRNGMAERESKLRARLSNLGIGSRG